MASLDRLDRRPRGDLADSGHRPGCIDEGVVLGDEHRERHARAAQRGSAVDAEQIRSELAARAHVRAEQIRLVVRELFGRDLVRVGEDPAVQSREGRVASKRTEERADG